MWLRCLIAGIAAGLLTFEASAQLVPIPTSQPVPVQPPMKLLGQLKPYPECGESCDSKEQKAERAEALRELGIPTEYFEEARLVFEDLDGDGVPEAVFTIDVDYADVVLAVLKQKDGQWFRLPSPPDFSCWCKYETSPLDTFVEIVKWSDSFENAGQPRRLILIRSSGGGTGLYERGVEAYALDGFQLRQVFADEEEYRECPWPEGECHFRHALLTFELRSKNRALIVKQVRVADDGRNFGPEQSWWVGLPVFACKAYTWNHTDFRFEANAATTSEFCAATHSSPGVNKPQHH